MNERFHKGKAMDLIMDERCGLSADAKLVAVYLINRSKPDSDRPGWQQAWPATKTIARALSLSPRAVERVQSEFRKTKTTLPVRIIIEPRYRAGAGGRDSNMYRLTIPASTADMGGEHTRQSDGHDAPSIPAKIADHARQNGGGIPAIRAEESSQEPSQEPSQGESPTLIAPPKGPKSRRAKSVPMPADFVPDASVYARAQALGFDQARVEREMVRMRDHAEREDRRCVNWQAAARSWLSKALEFDGLRPSRAATRNGAIPCQPGGWGGKVKEIS